MNVLLFAILFIILVLILSFIVCEFTKFTKFIKGGKSKNKLRLKNDNKTYQKLYNDDKKQNNDNKNHNGSYTMTYTISGEDNGLDYSQLRMLLKKFHFIEKPVTSVVDISFGTFGTFYLRGQLIKNVSYDPKFYRQRAKIKNVLRNYENFVDKSKLYNTVKKILPSGMKYLPKSYNSEEFEKMLKNSKYPVIVKKDNSGQQKGVVLVTSKEEYYLAKDKLHKLEIESSKIKNKKPNYDITISEYITNPLLLDGKKFHLRIHFLLSIFPNGVPRCIICNKNNEMILTAKEKYKNEDWKNTDIHLTGGHSTLHRYKWPNDIREAYPDNFETIKNNLNACNQFICSLIAASDVKKYPECYAGYYIFGADVMLDDNFHPYILEINDKPGFGKYGEDIGWEEYIKNYSFHLFSFILNNVIFPFFRIKKNSF